MCPRKKNAIICWAAVTSCPKWQPSAEGIAPNLANDWGVNQATIYCIFKIELEGVLCCKVDLTTNKACSGEKSVYEIPILQSKLLTFLPQRRMAMKYSVGYWELLTAHFNT